uniref:histidine kinase n=1 Tax=Hordeum vulgare subsp. vulgare TaxID=112509 RepID=F2ECN2_HORVV|nr:predicted protein [Hordeum vulgare subsp. vulgare]
MWQRGRQTCCRGGTSWGASAAVLFARISRTGRLQFGASIVVCGLTHLLAAFTYEPHSFVLVLLLTVAKCVTALVSFLAAFTYEPHSFVLVLLLTVAKCVTALVSFLTAFTYEPHSFVLVLLLTVAKCVTALVSFLTAITPLRLRLRLIPKQRSCSASRSASACSGSKPASSTS